MLRKSLSILLLVLLALPTAYRLAHALGDHKEIHCNEDIPNHFHGAERDCDFQKFHFAAAIAAPGLILSRVSSQITGIEPAFEVEPVFLCKRNQFALRAPPVL